MLKVENLYVSKRGLRDRLKRRDNPIIKGISFTLEPGNIYGLIGHNGAGKTTLLEAMYDLNKYKGRITIDGKSITESTDRIEFLSSTLTLSGNNKIMDVVSEVTNYDSKTTGKCFEILDSFCIDEYDRLLKKFFVGEQLISPRSKGERRLAKIANTLAFNKDIYLLDEPLAELDFSARSAVLEEVRKKALDNKIVVISSHELDDINMSIDSAIFIKNGSLVKVAVLDEIRENEGLDLKAAYIKEYGGSIK